MSEENEAVVDTSSCASCGIAEIDDIKLKEEALIVISFDTAAMHVKDNISHSTKKLARNERLNYMTNYYSSNRRAAILGIAPFAVYLCSSIDRNLP